MTGPQKHQQTRAALTREPELLEKLFLYLERRNIFHSVSVSVRVKGAQPITHELVFGSLRRLVLKYPLLFSFPEGEEPRIRWRPLDKIQFSDVFEIHTGESGDFGVDCRGNTLLNGISMVQRHRQRKPLWCMIYYRESGWFSLHCAHCFTDGSSIVAYLKEFVEGLNEVPEEGTLAVFSKDNFPEVQAETKILDSQGSKFQQNPGSNENLRFESIELFNLKKDLPLLTTGISPQFFDRVGYQPTFTTWIMVAMLRLVIAVIPIIVPAILETSLHISCFVDQLPVPYTRRSFFASDHIISESSPLIAAAPHFVNVPPKHLVTLLQACRDHGVKLQTYMVLVYVHTVHELHPYLYAHKYLKVGIPVSLRNVFRQLSSHNSFLGDEGRFEDGFYALSVKFFLGPNTTFSWQAVKKYHDFLHRTITSSAWLDRYYIASKTMTADHYMSHRVGVKKDDCFLICTNLGQIELLEDHGSGRFHIDNILFAPSSGSTVGTHHMTICSTKTSGLNIGFSDGDKNIEDWDLFRDTFRENLLRLSNDPP